ncbi:hypothetical protein [Phocaeicola massiliensis]|jgi:hypothetical protein|uniref:hypothetical protein n=1 Tax=Phocaeicola massiliensis TaxID=204516 RepID=UPI00319DDA90
MIKLKKYLNRPTYAVDRPWTLALLNATTIGLILAIFEPFHYRLNSIILIEYYVFLSGLHSLLPF